MGLVCSECKGKNIQTKMWIDPNTNEVCDNVSDGDSSDNWCDDCEDHVRFEDEAPKVVREETEFEKKIREDASNCDYGMGETHDNY